MVRYRERARERWRKCSRESGGVPCWLVGRLARRERGGVGFGVLAERSRRERRMRGAGR